MPFTGTKVTWNSWREVNRYGRKPPLAPTCCPARSGWLALVLTAGLVALSAQTAGAGGPPAPKGLLSELLDAGKLGGFVGSLDYEIDYDRTGHCSPRPPTRRCA